MIIAIGESEGEIGERGLGAGWERTLVLREGFYSIDKVLPSHREDDPLCVLDSTQ